MEKTNAINWFEIPVTNMKRAKEFYQKILDVKLQDMPREGMSYAFWPNGGIGGALAEGPNYVPSKTGSLCFLNGGDDLDNVLKKVNNARGNVIQAKTSIGPHGFIARKDGSISWMKSTDAYEQGVTLTDEYIEESIKSIDCYVMGSRTYEHALELGWPYDEVPVYVLTNRNLTTNKKNVEFYSGDLEKLINSRLKSNHKNIWMVGGSELTKKFIRLKLADEIVVSIMPIILGDGSLLFFDYIGQEQPLHLNAVTAFKDGMVELTYEIIKK